MKKFIHEITKVAKEVADCLLVCHCHDVIFLSSTQANTWHRDAVLVAMHVHARLHHLCFHRQNPRNLGYQSSSSLRFFRFIYIAN